jgi:hypothetical protein
MAAPLRRSSPKVEHYLRPLTPESVAAARRYVGELDHFYSTILPRLVVEFAAPIGRATSLH